MVNITEELKREVWAKGHIDKDYFEEYVRKDACGAWMEYEEYGNTNSPFGWQIDHIYPKSKLEKVGVPTNLIDDIDNLRPLNWRNNYSKSDSYPSYKASVKSKENRNEYCEEKRVISQKNQQKIKKLFQHYAIEF